MIEATKSIYSREHNAPDVCVFVDLPAWIILSRKSEFGAINHRKIKNKMR